MKGDFSRLSFDPRKHFSGVRMQQGRVQLDADWNEQLDITAHRIATEITDFIGQSGAPEGNAGFEIIVDPGKLSREDREQLATHKSQPLQEGALKKGEFLIGRGRYYVN